MKKTENQNKRIITEETIDNYCEWLAGREKSEGTIRKYRYYLQKFMEHMNGRSVDKGSLLIWKQYLRNHLAPITVNGALTALNGFFRFYRWEDCEVRFLKITTSPFSQESRELSKEEYLRLVDAAFRKGNERLSLLLQTVCSSGIRISELKYVTVEAVQKGKQRSSVREESEPFF